MPTLAVAADISLTRLQSAFLSLEHDKAHAEKRAAALEKRLLDEAAAGKRLEAEIASLAQQLEAAARACEEADLRVVTQRKEQDDERARHELHAQLASEKAAVQQQKLVEKGKELYTLEEQLRTRTSECTRLRIEQEGADSLISTFQARLEEVGKVIEATTRAEADCRAALAEAKETARTHGEKLAEAQQAQRAAAPREQVERRLKAVLRELADAKENAKQSAAQQAKRDGERQEEAVRRTELEERLAAAQRELSAAHDRSVASEGQRAALADQLALALAASLREQERSEALARRCAAADTHMRLLHAEVRACDRDRQAHEERTQRREQDALALRAPLEERTKQLEALRDAHADELESARREARERSAQVVRLSEELEDVKHERDRLLQQPLQPGRAPPQAPAPGAPEPSRRMPQATTQPPPPAHAPPAPALAPAPAAAPPTAPPPHESSVAESAVDPAADVLQTVSHRPSAQAQTPQVQAQSGPNAASPTPPPLPRASAPQGRANGELPRVVPRHHPNAQAVDHRYEELPCPSDGLPPAQVPRHEPPDASSASPAPPPSLPIVASASSAPASVAPPSGSTCTLCHEMLYGASTSCCKCRACAHATCAGRSAQDALKQWTCADCQPKLAKRPIGTSGEGAGSTTGARRSKQSSKRARTQHASAQQQNLLSLV